MSGGAVALYDPIAVDQVVSSPTDSRTFGMTVRGGGNFLWGGANTVYTGVYNAGIHDIDNQVNLLAGSSTTLLSAMTLTAPNHAFNLNSGARMNVMGKNVLDLSAGSANLLGHLHFNLDGTTVNELNTVLLTVSTPSGVAANIEGAEVSLSSFAAGPMLQPGDQFYLIQTDGANQLAGDPANNRAYARQGLTRGYNFIIDKQSGAGTEQQLVARLENSVSPPETRIISEGRAAALGFLVQNGSWLADHSYQQADLAIKQDDTWTAFAGIDGAWFRNDTGGPQADIWGTTMLAGLALKNTGDNSSFLLGGFVHAGYAKYDINGDFGYSRDMNADGDLRFVGVGLMARQRWHNGFRLEASLRGGSLENRFYSQDLRDTDGTAAQYEISTPYFGAHAGVGYEWKIDDASTLDFLARYYWTRQNGTSTDLPTGEEISFYDDNSHRVRAGSRYTYTVDEDTAWYVGAALEYEFDSRSRAWAGGHDVDVPEMGGFGGVGEIGLIVRPRDYERFSAEIGLQGYVGNIQGISGGIRIGWEF
jgi:hypothetical protein